MKISQMTTDQAADVLVRIADPVANIMHDEQSYQVLESLAKTDSKSAVKYFADNISNVVIILLKTHRADVYEIVAAMSGKTVEEISKQNIAETVKDIRNSWDGDLVDFFASAK